MCGIVGYIGEKQAPQILVDGLRRLEYRGYDSSGIAVLGENGVELRRSAGKLDNLMRLLGDEPVEGITGIGHTRWATHGRPTDANAHPHRDCTGDTVVIHNGIVENYLPLKHALLERGHHFRSETDTEVIAHLIEERLASGAQLPEALRQTAQQLRGNHAIVVMTVNEPDKLVTARIGNAGGIVIGVGEDEMYIASDLPAILEHTRSVAFLDDGEMAVVCRNGYSVCRLDGTPVDRPPQTVSWDPVSAAKGGYKHFMLKEIHEQPRALTDTISTRIALDPPRVYFEDLGLSDEELSAFDRVLIVACGTSWHSGLVGKFMIEEIARIPVEVDYADEFRYRQLVANNRTLMIAITQSGETVDLLVSMAEARKHGVKTIAIVNAVGSQAARVADGRVYTFAGPEIAVASTKAFTSQIAVLYLLALKLGTLKGLLGCEELQERLTELVRVPSLVGKILEDETPYVELANRFYHHKDFLYLARGINYPVALEGALKLKEISYIHAEGYPAGEMKHGPIALIDDEMPVLAVATRDRVFEKTLSNIEEARTREGIVIALVNEGEQALKDKADYQLEVPFVHPHLAPILNVVPLQLLAYYMAVRRGVDVDQPRNLAKSVTVE